MQHHNSFNFRKLSFTLGAVIIVAALTHALLLAGSGNIRRISLGTGSVEGDGSSFHLYYSQTGDLFVFQSYATNWDAMDPVPVKQDVFIRDAVSDTTWQITHGEDDSFEPVITRDGRYVAFTSYAGDLVPNDNNTTSIWIRDGLDVFLYDRVTSSLQRVSLNSRGEEILGNSIGIISPDASYVVFLSNGTNVIFGEGNGARNPALYIRDWRTGSIERITSAYHDPDAFPNGGLGQMSISSDGRYITFVSEASNLVPNDTNGVMDVFLYDTFDKTTRRISQQPGGGSGNGASARPQISGNGAYIAFHSEASNLVAGDTNGQMDIFVYTVGTGEIERVSVTSDAAQSNGLSREPAICESGRFVAYTSEATNLVANDTNGQRDVFVRDRVLDETFVVSKSDSGALGNGRAHRATMSPDCKTVGFASDATNFIPSDSNASRDLYSVTLLWPQFDPPTMLTVGEKAPGETVTFAYRVVNSGTEAGSASFSVEIPAGLTVDGGSLSDGAVFGGGMVSWSGSVSPGGTQLVSFEAAVDASLTDFTTLAMPATISGGGETHSKTFVVAVNGIETYLPLAETQ